jgi:predicted metalloprotease
MSGSEQQAEIRRPKFDGTVNLGHILTAFSMLIAGLLVWSQSMVVQAKQDMRILGIEQSVLEQRSSLKQMADTQQIAIRNQDKMNTAIEYLTQQRKP